MADFDRAFIKRVGAYEVSVWANKMKLMIGGGGTGGHIYPGVAVARELKKRGREHEALFVGAKRGLESEIVPKEGFEIKTLNITALKGKGIIGGIVSFARLIGAVGAVLRLMRVYKPDVVLGVGGYASGPVGLAALITGAPLALAEQNASPGMTNKWLGRFAAKVFLTWPGSENKFPKGVGKLTGNPIRPDFFEVKRKSENEKLNILVIGGSQGAGSINKALIDAAPLLDRFADSISVVCQSGRGDLKSMKNAFEKSHFPFVIGEFFEDMPQKIANADLLISRAGAGAIAEINAVGRAAVYVPYPFASDDHQTKNANVMENAGAGMVVKDSEFDGDRLIEIIEKFIHDRAGLEEMGKRANKMAKPDAAASITDELLVLAGEALPA